MIFNMFGGGGKEIKIVTGTVEVIQRSGELIVAIDFDPLMIFSSPLYGVYTETGTNTSSKREQISFRQKADANFSSYSPTFPESGPVMGHAYDAATGRVTFQPSVTYGYRTNTIRYVIMGV